MNNSKSLLKTIVAVVICLSFTACKYGGTCIEGNCTNGQGTLTFPDGRKYAGEFKDIKFNGQGTMTWPDGRVEHGIWKNNKIEKFVE